MHDQLVMVSKFGQKEQECWWVMPHLDSMAKTHTEAKSQSCIHSRSESLSLSLFSLLSLLNCSSFIMYSVAVLLLEYVPMRV